ncbi:MAG TPA: secretin N-terminal domain-containing protein, partial [Gammaproteobacteria bacterium]|nr:secretin N-terminal domain-containing protein [Gammaproteobacteria bacterium]
MSIKGKAKFYSFLVLAISAGLNQIAYSQIPTFQVHAQQQAQTSQLATAPQNGSGNLSFYFQNIELRTLLQLISKISNLNFVISDAVKGSVTLNLKNVTWQEALNIVLKTHGLSARQISNVMFINTLDEVSKMDIKEFEADQQVVNMSPLNSAIIQLKYMSAKDLADILKGSNNTLLTTRGQVVVDPRTNSAIIRDISTNIADIKKLV